MFKKNILATSIAGTMLVVSGHAFAATGDFTATAELQSLLEVNCGDSLDFGTVSLPADYTSGGTVTVAATSDAVAEVGGTGGLVVTGGGSVSCTITGADGEATVTLSETDVTLTGPENAEMSAAISTSQVTAGAFNIGGTLTVDETVLGTYTSQTITVTVADERG
jgi:hypothetical protein